MKNKLSLLITLTLATIMATGCDALDSVLNKNKNESEQQQSENTNEKEQSDVPVNPARSYFIVSFDANGGTGEMEPDRTHGSEFYAPRCPFTYIGHSFYKWALNSLDGTEYEEGEKISGIEEDITLYALWIEDTYTVSFNANGGTGEMSPVQALGEYVLPESEFTKNGHTFDSWAFGSISGQKHYPNEKVNIDSDITLYAIWILFTV